MRLLLPPFLMHDLVLLDLVSSPEMLRAVAVEEDGLVEMLVLALLRVGVVRRGRLASILVVPVELGLVLREVKRHLDLALVARVRADEVERVERFGGERVLLLRLVVRALRGSHGRVVGDVVVLLHVLRVAVSHAHVPQVLHCGQLARRRQEDPP